MLSQHTLARQWRILATGICFLTFISIGFIINLIVLPVILITSCKREHIESRSIRSIHYAFKIFMKYMKILSPIKSVNIRGMEQLQSMNGCIFIANHPTLIDAVAVISCLPYCHCIVRKSLLDHFYMGDIMRAAGYITNEQATKLIEDCKQSFKAGRSLLIFPEGSRSPAYGLGPFNRGAAQIALRTGAPVIPILITCEPPTLLRGDPWYAVPERPMNFTLQFFSPINISDVVDDQAIMALQVRELNRYFEDYFRRELGVHASNAS